jgi:hypothetical protein
VRVWSANIAVVAAVVGGASRTVAHDFRPVVVGQEIHGISGSTGPLWAAVGPLMSSPA